MKPKLMAMTILAAGIGLEAAKGAAVEGGGQQAIRECCAAIIVESETGAQPKEW